MILKRIILIKILPGMYAGMVLFLTNFIIYLFFVVFLRQQKPPPIEEVIENEKHTKIIGQLK